MLAILDYKAGNQTSVRRALEHLGIPCAITADPATLESAHGIIFPGVGAAGQAMRALHPAGLDNLLRDAVKRGQPLLGICLGCQILLERSEENDMPTLGLVPGVCRRFEDNLRQEDGSPAPVPHMGWNSLHLTEKGKKHPLFKYSKEGDYVYFVHSFYGKDCDESLLATSEYGIPVTASAANENVMGCQFHPEKSGEVGLRILKAFSEI